MWPLQVAWYRTFQFVFNFAARILHWRKAKRIEGAGCIAQIPALCSTLHMHKPMVVTDPGLMRAGVATQVLDVLEAAHIPYALYENVEPNPSVKTVNAIQAQYLAAHCDGLIAIGGGSAMDATKGAGARIVFPRKSVNSLGGLLKVYKRIPPFIAVPTTAGTGSETTIAALITDTDTHHKYAIMDLHLIPLYAVLDPSLTVGLPPHITATTGMDALTHAIEAYLCWTYGTKQSIGFAEEATVLICKYLEKAYQNGQDIQARMQMQIAAYLAGFAFTRAGVGNIHAIAHTLGGLYNIPHGLANAIILPIVLEDYGKKVYPKLARLASLTGIAAQGSEEERAKAFIAAIRAMNARMGIGTGFDCIQDADIEQMVCWASSECNPLYPVPVLYNRKRYRRVIERMRIAPVMKIGGACIGCGACKTLCPVFAITGEKNEIHRINERRCVGCKVCARVCPHGAITGRDGHAVSRLPRAQWPRPNINPQLCSACSICVTLCTPGALRIAPPKEKGDIHVSAELYDAKRCVGCAICANSCPLGATVMEAATPKEKEAIRL